MAEGTSRGGTRTALRRQRQQGRMKAATKAPKLFEDYVTDPAVEDAGEDAGASADWRADGLDAFDASLDSQTGSDEEPPDGKRGRRRGKQSGPKKVGRPITFQGDINDPALTDADRRRIKRRIANRESARRVRQKRQEVIEDMQTQVAQLQRQNAALLGRLNMAEQERRSMHRKLSLLRDKCADAEAENGQLQQQVLAARGDIALAGAHLERSQHEPHPLQAATERHAGEGGVDTVCDIPGLEPLKRGIQQAAAINGDIPAVVTPDRAVGEGTARSSRAAETKAKAVTHGAAGTGNGGAGSPAGCLLSTARSLQQLLEAGGPLASALSPPALPASGAFTLPQLAPLNLFSGSAERGVRSPSPLPPAEGRNSSIHAALDSWFLNRPASTDVLSDILASVSDVRP